MNTRAIMALARFQRTPEGVRVFQRNGYAEETIVPCHEAELIRDVYARIVQTSPPILLAVHFPDREGVHEFTFIRLTPESGVPVEGARPDPDVEAGVTSTSGMLADALSGKGPGRLVLTWSSVAAEAFALA